MPKLFKFVWVSLLLTIGLQSALAYSLLGPIGNGGDNWQVKDIGYGLTSDLGAPKNLGEEYRINVPVIYYAYDAAFLDYFGSTGSTNVDGAFYILNNLTNVSSYSADLSEFPLNSQTINYTAQALNLTDLKSYAMGLLAEHLGLASPDRYVWTLHNRYQPPNTTCPVSTEYLVVQRNYDITTTPLNQIQYSPFVNSTLYSYQILETCTTTPEPEALAVPYLVDPLAQTYTPVASAFGGNVYIAGVLQSAVGLNTGGFYTGFSRDDIAGLRYLINSNNINTEGTTIAGSLLLLTNQPPPQLLTTLPFSLLVSQALTNNPSTLQTNYPGIAFTSIATNVVTAISTNITAYYTNLAGPYTNSVAFSNGMAVYPTNGIIPFTNWSPVQYGAPFALTTLPLAELAYFAQYIDPVTLQLLYPNLVINSVLTNYLAAVISTNVVPYFTNQSVLPVFTNYVHGGLTNGFYFTNQPGPTVINYDITAPFSTISTLDLANFSDLSRTSSPAVMQTLYPGLQILRATTSPAFVAVTNYVNYLTNRTGSPYQGPPIAVTKPISTNYLFITNWNYTFGNVLTNHYYTNRFVKVQSIWITNQIGAPYGSPLVYKTNYVTIKTNMISGDFFIIPTNWCGFEVAATLPPSTPPYLYGVTNTVFYNGYNTNGATGTNLTANSYGLVKSTFDLYTNYSYAVYPGICEPVLGFGTNYTTNIVNQYQYSFLNVVTNHYYSNSLVSLFITNVYSIPGGSPDLLGTNITVANYYTNIPSGDFYIVPTNWCGYQITPLLSNYIIPTNISFGTNSTGTNNLQYSYVRYLSYTNYTYSINPGVCEPALAFGTNFSTNIVTQYQYNFGNTIVTNNPFRTNSPVIVITTNIAILTNGPVGTYTNIVTTNTYFNGISGDFFVVPPAWCGYSILATQLTSVVISTNSLQAGNPLGLNIGLEQYNQSTYSSYTNATLLIQPSICTTAAATPALRRGVEKIQFIRGNYDSLLGQFFAPITNRYTMVKITNSQPVTEYYQRVIAAPDIIFSAADVAPDGAATDPADYNTSFRTISFDQSSTLTGLAGPGLIAPATTITFNKVGPVYYNTSPYFLNGPTIEFGVLWGSFDGSTNTPVVYPNGTSIADIEAMATMQVSPANLPDGTNGVAYPVISFTATGGQAPYTWAAPNFSNSVPGMSFIGGSTNLLSGTPTASGTFNFILQVTDSLNRVVNLNYPLVVH